MNSGDARTADDREDLDAAGSARTDGVHDDGADADEMRTNGADMAPRRPLHRARTRLSLMALTDMKAADRASLNQNGYQAIARARSNRRMERFIERLTEEMGLEIVDV